MTFRESWKSTHENFYSQDPNNPFRHSLKLHRLDYLRWINERWNRGVEDPIFSETSFKWSLLEGYENHNWCSPVKDPFHTFFKRLSRYENSVIYACTGVGKTFLSALAMCYFLDVHMMDGCRIVAIGPTSTNLEKNLFSDFKKHFKRLKELNPWIEWKKDGRMQFTHPETGGITEILAAGVPHSVDIANSNISGHHDRYMLFIFDETQGVQRPAINAAVQTCVSPENVIIAIGNPNKKQDSLYALTQKSNFKAIRVCAYDYPNVVKKKAGLLKRNELGIEEPYIHGAITYEQIQQFLTDYGEKSDFYVTRILGQFPEKSGASIISPEQMYACYKQKNFKQNGYYSTVGVDIAVSIDGDDASACYLNDSIVTEINTFKSPKSTAIAHNMMYSGQELEDKLEEDNLSDFDYNLTTVGLSGQDVFLLEEEYHLGIDCTANPSTMEMFNILGMAVTALYPGSSPVKDIIKQDANGKPELDFYNLRTQLIYLLLSRLQSKTINFDIPEDVFALLVEEVTAFRLDENADRKIKLEPKKQTIKRLGRSPNRADSLFYALILQAVYEEGLEPFVISGEEFERGVEF